MQLEDDVPDFPRGGGSSLSREELDEVRAEVDAEFEAEGRGLKKNKKKRVQKQSHSAEDDLGSLFGVGISGKLPRKGKAEQGMRFGVGGLGRWGGLMENISPGMKLWGVISEVNEKDIVISLPGGLRGLVRASEAFDPFSDNKMKDVDCNSLSSMYYVGQLVACIVLQLDDHDDKKEKGKPKIWLSLRLSLLHKCLSLDVIQEGMVLTSYVKSIEDHGYILHFGSPSFSGFMPNSSQAESRAISIRTGHLLQGVVKSIDKTRKVVYLTSDPDTVSKCVTKELKGISIDLLIPGMMVNARVQSTLENGIMLSFLTYFTGTVDMFHLQTTFPNSNWKDDYNQNKKVNARILFIDPSTRAIGLTLNPHLVHHKSPPSKVDMQFAFWRFICDLLSFEVDEVESDTQLVKAGDIFDHSKVIRVDRGFGLLLEIPTAPFPTPAYVSVSDVADKEVKKLEKTFRKEAMFAFGFLDLSTWKGSLWTSAFEGSVFTHSDVKPGMVVKAKVIIVDSFGAIVQFPSGVKALCPLRHMSEFEISKPRKKFQVGADLQFRVLGCKSKRITVTHKKTLVKSKLGIISSYTDATEGLITHGWIAKIESHGCFVRFYNGVQGFAPRSELGLEAGCDPVSGYHVEEVVKCRVTTSVPASRRINLSFTITPARVSEDDMIKLGSIVSGVVERVTPHAIVVHVRALGNIKGTINPEHLADHQGFAALMKSALKPGYESSHLEIGSAKTGLSANDCLSNRKKLESVQVETLVEDLHSDEKRIFIDTGRVDESGDSGLRNGASCSFQPLLKFDDYVEGSNLILTAKHSLINSAQQLPAEVSQVRPHTVVHGYVCNLIESGCFVRYVGRLTGFIPRCKGMDDRRANPSEVFYIGQSVRTYIMDVSSETGRVTLSLKQSLCSSTDASFIQEHFLLEDKIAKLQVLNSKIPESNWVEAFSIGNVVEGKVNDVKDSGVVVSFEKYNDVFGFVTHHQLGGISLKTGSTIQAAVLDVAKIERLVELSVKPAFVDKLREETSSMETNKKVLSIPECNFDIGYASLTDYNTQKFPPRQYVNGQSVIATVMALPNPATAGRLLLALKSMSDVAETSSSKRAKKNSSFDVGALVQAEVTEIKPLELKLKFGSGFHGRVHITEATDDNVVEDPFKGFRIGQTVTAAIISKTSKSENNQRTISGNCPSDLHWLQAQLYLLDSACEPTEIQEFQKRYNVGKAICGYVLNANKEKKMLRLVLHPFCDVVGGRISKVFPGVGGMLIQIDPRLYGKVHFTELTDSWDSNPLSGYHEGQFVKCKVLEISHSGKGTLHVELSLRSSLDGMHSQKAIVIGDNELNNNGYLNARKYDGGFNKEELNTIFNTIHKNFSAWVRAFAPVAMGVNNSHAIAEFETSLGRMKPEIAFGVAKTVFLSDLRRVLPQVHVPSTIIQSKKDVIVPEFIAIT
ncbi:hypothetical protein C3L33_02796, partial [Rhododendron williamsianum]